MEAFWLGKVRASQETLFSLSGELHEELSDSLKVVYRGTVGHSLLGYRILYHFD